MRKPDRKRHVRELIPERLEILLVRIAQAHVRPLTVELVRDVLDVANVATSFPGFLTTASAAGLRLTERE